MHDVADALPDANTDVLIWDASSTEAQLGAFDGEGWVDAQGGSVQNVTHWADMPRIAKPNDEITTPHGERIDLRAPWPIPTATRTPA